MYKSLTEREQEVIKLMFEGLENDEIAERLIISTHTVKAHLIHIFDKLNCKRGRIELMARRIKELENA